MTPYDLEWKRTQLTRPIGANAIAAIVGVHPFFYRDRDGLSGFQRECIAVKRGDPIEFPDRKSEDIGGDLARGLDTEPIHARQLARYYPDHCMMLHDQCDFVYADGVSFGHCLPDAGLDGPERFTVEMKCPRSWKARVMRLKGPADYYVVGAHWTTIFTGLPVILSIFDPDSWSIAVRVVIKPNRKTQRTLLEAASKWHQLYVVDEHPLPEKDAEPIEIDKEKGKVKTSDDPKLRRAALELLSVGMMMADMKELYEAAKMRVLAHYDPEFDAIESPGVLRAWNSASKGRETFAHKKCVAKYPEAVEFYRRGKSFRTFRSYDLRPPDERVADND